MRMPVGDFDRRPSQPRHAGQPSARRSASGLHRLPERFAWLRSFAAWARRNRKEGSK